MQCEIAAVVGVPGVAHAYFITEDAIPETDVRGIRQGSGVLFVTHDENIETSDAPCGFRQPFAEQKKADSRPAPDKKRRPDGPAPLSDQITMVGDVGFRHITEVAEILVILADMRLKSLPY